MNKQHIKNVLLSNENINTIVNSGRWISNIHLGTNIIDYFIDHNLIYEYANSKLKKIIIKDYLLKKIDKVFDDLDQEDRSILYRSIYTKNIPSINHKHDLGIFWSSNPYTGCCVQKDNDSDLEVTFLIKFPEKDINWLETIRSRTDYYNGDREKEYQLFSGKKVNIHDLIIY
jgi:hypothetical protein